MKKLFFLGIQVGRNKKSYVLEASESEHAEFEQTLQHLKAEGYLKDHSLTSIRLYSVDEIRDLLRKIES